MDLKDYQRDTLEAVRSYLEKLTDERRTLAKAGLEDIDPAERAWSKTGRTSSYRVKKDGLGRSIPNVCLKIPTGGGKTFLAVKSLDLIQSVWRGRRTGLVLWVVPTSQIYKQTYDALRDREHPYRQGLDVASGGRTKIIERGDALRKADIEENLVVMMLMIQAGAVTEKQKRTMFRDAGFTDFFPPEDNRRAQAELRKRVLNLRVFEDETGFSEGQVMTSLENVFKVSDPVIILDESQKARSSLAQELLKDFNPSFILELSATPHDWSNLLVEISGETLEKEQMIKLPLHVHNLAGADWQKTLHASMRRLDALQRSATKLDAKSGRHIRPIMLVQAERVGKDQREKGYIHSEDVKAWLLKNGVPEASVAIKTADQDELKDLAVGELMSRDCPIRFIITKAALQEGWDCAFAYVLTVLTNPSSKTALTQLVGRVLRQPDARKTGVAELDECYVYCFKPNASALLEDIRNGFSREGLGDMADRVTFDEWKGTVPVIGTISKRVKKFDKVAGKLLLPMFVAREGKGWRPLNYVSDVESLLPWDMLDCPAVAKMTLEHREAASTEHVMDAKGANAEVSREAVLDEEAALDEHFIVRNLDDIIPNPWVAHEIVERVMAQMVRTEKRSVIVHNLPTIMARLRECLSAEKDALAETLFRQAVKDDRFRFLLVQEEGFAFPKTMTVETEKKLTRQDHQELQRSLFDVVPSEWFNGDERAVVWYLDQHEKLFFWYRNRERKDYALQGWKRGRMYPDFIFTEKGGKDGFSKVHIVETKGLHLDNPDTDYKKALMDLCNRQTSLKDFSHFGKLMAGKKFEFNVIFTRESWKADVNKILR